MVSDGVRALFKKNKVGVLMPTYNNDQTVAIVLSHVLEYTDQVIVVNDGSTDATLERLQPFPKIDLISYPANQGKGYALRKGFQRAVASGYDYVISIDSDGQHFAEDLSLFLDKLENNPAAIIIGVRNMAHASVPGKSSFGNTSSSFWFWVMTGLKMSDTQSGYRLYPVKHLNDIKFITKKFEFEIEVLVLSAWRGIPITEVPVRVFYPEKGKRVSHFRPLVDVLRIIFMDTILVIIASAYIKPRDFLRRIKKKQHWQIVREQLFNPGEPDWIKAFSIGFGIFMGIVPLWGFQMIIALFLSILFRLNKALVIVAANISIPPMIPLVLFLSHLTGALWMGNRAQHISFSQKITLELMQTNSVQYVLGAITLAFAAGIVFGGLTYLGLKLFKQPEKAGLSSDSILKGPTCR
jgi:glycosyltransferase involved in cell wall biosynthesis